MCRTRKSHEWKWDKEACHSGSSPRSTQKPFPMLHPYLAGLLTKRARSGSVILHRNTVPEDQRDAVVQHAERASYIHTAVRKPRCFAPVSWSGSQILLPAGLDDELHGRKEIQSWVVNVEAAGVLLRPKKLLTLRPDLNMAVGRIVLYSHKPRDWTLKKPAQRRQELTAGTPLSTYCFDSLMDHVPAIVLAV